MPSWEQEKAELFSAGFNETEVFEEEQRQRKQMFRSGFHGQEIDEYFGAKDFDPAPLKEYFGKNLEDYKAKASAKRSGEGESMQTFDTEFKAPKAKHAESFWEAIQAGWQMSVSGLIKRGGMPDIEVAQGEGMFYNIASQLGTLAGDIPAMWAGGAGGGAAGGAIGAPGGPTALVTGAIGAGAGAFALPAAVRKMLVDYYEKGSVKSASDFWERAAATFIETAKGGIIGGATVGAAGIAGKVLAKPLAAGVWGGAISEGTGAAITKMGATTAEVATMVTVGKALEGELPEPKDFLEAGIVVGGLHLLPPTAKALRNIYAETGFKPHEAVDAIAKDPVLKQEVLSKEPRQEVINERLTGEPAASGALANSGPLELLGSERGSLTGKDTVVEPTVSEASKALLENVAEKKKASKGERLVKAIPTWSEFYTAVVDRFDPIHKAVEWLNRGAENLKADENPYILSRLANDFKAKVKHIFQKGTLDHKSLAINGEGLGDILKPHKQDLQNVRAYLIADRIVELDKRGIKYLGEGAKNDAALQNARVVLKEGASKYAETAKRLVDFQNRNLQYLRDSGRLSAEMYELFVKVNEKYIPFSRVFDAKDGVAKLGKAGFLKAIEGGDFKIQDPFTSIVENTQTLVQMAEKNRAVKALVELAEKNSGQELLTKVSEQTGEGIQQGGKLRDNQFEVWRDGKREVWETEPQLAQAVRALDGDIASQNLLFKLAHGSTKLLKLGITFTPDFVIKNFLRDQATAAAFGSKFAPWETLWAMGDIFKKSDVYYNWLKGGGAGGAFIELNQRYFTKDFLDIQKSTGFLDGVWNKMKDGKAAVDAAARLVEEATRLAEFKRVTKGETSGTKVFEGGFASREVTLDFQRIGAKMSQLNAITAFQNVGIQGLDKTARALRAAWDNPGTAGKAMLPGVALITTASVLNWWNNHDEDWYKEINRWEKDLFWHIKVGDVITRWPKPQELGIAFGTMAERTLDRMFTDNPNSFKDFHETIANLITPSVLPDAITPFAEHYANKVFFTGNPVVSQSAERLLPAYQYTDYTSETAKMLGKMIGTLPLIRDIGPGNKTIESPMVIENYIRDWGGSWGMYALKLLDQGLYAANIRPNLKAEGSVADIPFVKAFVSRYPSANSQSIKDFRELYRETETIWNTINQLKKSGKGDDISWLLEVHQNDMIKLRGIQEALINVGHAIQMTNADTKMTPTDKRQLIDKMYFTMIEMAKTGNKASRDIKAKLKKLE